MQFRQILTRPVLGVMAYTAMIAWSVYALSAIPMEVLPRFDYPQISIVAHDPGASANEMEALVVRPLEGEILGLSDVVSLRSSMGLGTAELTARFRAGTDPQVDLQAAYGAIARARGSLPPGVSPYAEIMGNAINEVADYSLAIPADVSPAVVQRAIKTRILPALRGLAGVQRIELFGSGDEVLWVQPRLLALRRHGVGIDSLTTALADQVALTPAGRLSLGHQDVPIELRSLPLSTKDVRRIPVPTAEGPVPVDTLAQVIRGPQPIHYAVDLDGRPSIALIVFKQTQASTVPVTRAVARTLQDLQGQLPAGARWQRVYDQGYLVSLLRSDVGRNLLVGGALAVAMLFWILGAQRSVWVLALSIPLALLFAISGLYALGQTLNLLTLGALTVAVGLLADDGIIVLEAIFHRWEGGQLATEGVWQGLKDIAAPDVSGTLTTVATYLPLVGVSGLAGLFFVPFALAMSLALLGSLAISLTLIPLAAAQLGPSAKPRQTSGAKALEVVRRQNERLLEVTIRHPGLSLLAAALLLAVGAAALMLTPTHFLPLPNEGVLLDSFTLAPGASLNQTQATLIGIAERMRQDQAVAHTLVRIGSAPGTAYTERSFAGELQAVLQPSVKTTSLDSLSNQLLARAKTVGVQQSIDTPTIERFGESLSGLPQPFVVEIFGNHLPTLRKISVEAVKRLRTVSALTDIFNNDAYPVTQLRIVPRPEAMRAFGVTPADLQEQLRPALRGDVIAQMPDGDYHLDLYIRLADAEQLSPEELGHTLIHTRRGWTPLHLLADVKLVTLPNEIRHLDGARVLDILATPRGSTNGAIANARHALAGLSLPAGYRIGFTGLYLELDRAAVMLGVAAVVALILMAGILILHFGGWRTPLILLLQVPLAFTGGALALALSGIGLNAIALVGFLTLIGISLNHGIVLLHRAREAERDGLAPPVAAREAVRIRFRPIFLTTLTAVLGMLPTALGWGIGAAPEQGLAVVILGGVLWSSILSTNLLPALYLRWHHP
jgi:cobalt-zinc-cadmium resistance protein CzcA